MEEEGSNLVFDCTVCKGEFNSKDDWIRHLLFDPMHTELARFHHLKEWKQPLERARFVVVSSSQHSVASDDRILQYFSQDIWTTGLVTNFIWWPDKPGVGFIQFENSKIANEVVKSMSRDGQFFLNDQMFKVEAAEKLSVKASKKLIYHPSLNAEIHNNVPSSSTSSSFSAIRQSRNEKSFQLQYSSQRNSFFIHLLDLIRLEVEIPVAVYDRAVYLVSFLNQYFSSYGEEITVSLMRNWTFKLRFYQMQSKSLSIFCMNKKMQPFDNFMYLRALRQSTTPSFRPDFELNEDDVMSVARFNAFDGVQYQVKASAVYCYPCSFSLYGNLSLAMDAQLWNLANYLCSFDPRSKTLMEVVCFWTNINHVQVGVDKIMEEGERFNLAPDPLVLIWMVVFFLASRKIIPAPVTVLDQAHEHIFYSFDDEKVDIGFAENFTFRENWKRASTTNHTAEDGFTLVIDFFLFWGRFAQGQWVIYTRKVEFYETKDFLNLLIYRGSASGKNLKKLQENVLRMMKEGKKGRAEETKAARGLGIFGINHSIHFTNPFCSAWTLPIRKKPLKLLGKTGEKLKRYLEELKLKSYRNGSGETLGKNQVRALLTVSLKD